MIGFMKLRFRDSSFVGKGGRKSKKVHMRVTKAVIPAMESMVLMKKTKPQVMEKKV